jgi:hypothetical protein
LYQTAALPGNSLQPTPPTHAPVLNNMVYITVDTPRPIYVNEVPKQVFTMSQNVPNPAVNTTSITVLTKTEGSINLSISNLLGQAVYQANVDNNSHSHTFNVNVSNFDSGIYFYTVKIGNNSVTKKMLVK